MGLPLHIGSAADVSTMFCVGRPLHHPDFVESRRQLQMERFVEAYRCNASNVIGGKREDGSGTHETRHGGHHA